MDFRAWAEAQEHGTLAQIQRDTGVGYTTLMRAKRGDPIKEYATAKRISEATGGEVSIEDLCEPAPPADDNAPTERTGTDG